MKTVLGELRCGPGRRGRVVFRIGRGREMFWWLRQECLTPERGAAGTDSNREKRVNGLTSVFFRIPRGFSEKAPTTAKPADPLSPSHSPIHAFRCPQRLEIWHDDRKESRRSNAECHMSGGPRGRESFSGRRQ